MKKKHVNEGRAGNGRDCISHPEHGPSIVMSGSSREWCPHSEHDGVKARNGVKAAKPTTPFLDKQEAPEATQEEAS